MSTTLSIVLILVAVVAAIVLTWSLIQSRTRKTLQQKFGPEYDTTVRKAGSRREAEAELIARRKRVAQLQLRTLSPSEHAHFLEAWRDVQASFVDDPRRCIRDADKLVGELMQTIGYPVGDFDQRAADISVDHPHVVRNYRAAHEVAVHNERGEASTDDLRNAVVLYRDLFAELLGAGAEISSLRAGRVA